MKRIACAFSIMMLACVPLRAGEPVVNKAAETVRTTDDQAHQLGVVAAEQRPFRAVKAAIGQIAFNEDASSSVLSPFSGRITRLIAGVGTMVKRGDPLFEIDSPEVVQAQTDLIAAAHAVEKERSHVELAKSVLERQQSLLAGRATAQREVDQARNDYSAAQSDLSTAQGTLTSARNRLRVIIGRDQDEVARVERERTINPLITVNAPIDGTVIGRKIGPGQYVRSDAGESLFQISDLSVMWLRANVPENDIPYVQVGQEIEVRVNALPDRVYRARITVIGAASDASTRRIVVRSEIPNPDGALRAEMFATFKIKTGPGQDSPAVPANAVIWQGDRAVIWVEKEPLLFQRRSVTAGLEQDGYVEIRSGLRPGERVVSRGAIFLDNEWQL